MKTLTYKLRDLKKLMICIGFEDENNRTQVRIDCGEVFGEYPNAAVSMKVQAPKGGIYPASVTREGNMIMWTVRDCDVANKGSGEFQLTFTDGTTVIKTCVGRFHVDRSLKGSGTAPSGVQDWLENAEKVLEQVESAEINQPMIGLDGYWYKWDQEAQQYVTTGEKARGENGKGIDHIAKTGTSGNVDTYTIFYTDGTESTYTVKNGENGVQIDDDTPALNKVFSSYKVNDELTRQKNAIVCIENDVLDIEEVEIPSKNLNVTPYEESYTHHGITFEVNSDNSVTVSGTPESGGAYYPYPSTSENFRWKLPAGKYTLSGAVSNNKNLVVYLYETKSASSYEYMYSANNGTVTFTTTSEYWAVVVIAWTNTSAITEPVTIYPQLESGETPTAYVSPFSDETKKESRVIEDIKQDIIDLQNTEVNVLSNLWKGKKVVFLGDSIVYGQNSDHPYSYYIAELTGITAYNYGIGSKKMLDWADCYAKVTQYQTVGDAFIIGFGTNDFNGDVPIGDFYTLSGTTRVPNTDGTTFKGAMRNLVSQIRTSFPSAVIIFVTPLHRGGNNSDLDATQNGRYLSDYVNAIKEGADVLSYEVIDLYSVLGVDPNFSSQSAWFDSAELHPGTVVHKRIAKVIGSKMRSIGIGYGNTVYNVTNTLTHCTNSNSSTTVNVDEGETVSYSATITADNGYELSSVSCTMGGVAQTVENGVISIASVTGDIVITAIATESQYIVVQYSDLTEVGKYIKSDGSLANGSSYKAVYFECTQGKKYIINSYSGQVAIVWGITNSIDSAPYSLSDYGTEAQQAQRETTVTASASGYMIVNHKTTGTLSIVMENT